MSKCAQPSRWIALALLLPVVLLGGVSLWLVRSESQRSEEAGKRLLEQYAAEAHAVQRLSCFTIPAWLTTDGPPTSNAELEQELQAAAEFADYARIHEAAMACPQPPYRAAGFSLAMLAAYQAWKMAPAELQPVWAEKTASTGLAQLTPVSISVLTEVLPALPEENAAVLSMLLQGPLAEALASARLLAASQRSGTTKPVEREDKHTATDAAGNKHFYLPAAHAAGSAELKSRWQKILPAGAMLESIWRGQPAAVAMARITHSLERPPFTYQLGFTHAAGYFSQGLRPLAALISGLSIAVLCTGVAMWLVWRSLCRQARLSMLQSDFVASVSHELRTPVASIGVLAERLESGRLDEAKSAQYRQWIAREGRRLAGLVDNILDFSRIERNRKHYEKVEIDLPRLVAETVAILQPYAEEKRLLLAASIDWPPAAPQPSMDPVAIRQALINLIENALKFAQMGPEVLVELKYEINTRLPILLSVTDSGPGIPEKERERVLERFYRIPQPAGQEATGAGIGLSIVQHIVTGHAGVITITQATAAGGTRVAMRFPET